MSSFSTGNDPAAGAAFAIKIVSFMPAVYGLQPGSAERAARRRAHAGTGGAPRYLGAAKSAHARARLRSARIARRLYRSPIRIAADLAGRVRARLRRGRPVAGA